MNIVFMNYVLHSTSTTTKFLMRYTTTSQTQNIFNELLSRALGTIFIMGGQIIKPKKTVHMVYR